MKVLITGGMGVNGAVTARLLVQKGLRPVLLDNRMDLSLIRDINDRVDCVEADVCDQRGLEKTVADYNVTHIAHRTGNVPIHAIVTETAASGRSTWDGASKRRRSSSAAVTRRRREAAVSRIRARTSARIRALALVRRTVPATSPFRRSPGHLSACARM